jgi:hypothetical protein
MRVHRGGLTLLTVALIGLASCATQNDALRKPPPATPEFTVPPTDDSRFSNPIAYPEKTLNQPLTRPSDPVGPGAGKVPSSRGGVGGGGM